MMNFENTIEIQCSVEEVFTFVADFENIPKWNYYVKSVRKLSDMMTDVGAVYHQIRKSDQQYFQIAEYRVNEAIVIETITGSQPQFERRFVFEPVVDGTKIIDTWKLELGHNSLIQLLGVPRVKTAVKDNLRKLKTLLETGRTQLQDGRIITVEK